MPGWWWAKRCSGSVARRSLSGLRGTVAHRFESVGALDWGGIAVSKPRQAREERVQGRKRAQLPAVHRLAAQGHSPRTIARKLGLKLADVRRELES